MTAWVGRDQKNEQVSDNCGEVENFFCDLSHIDRKAAPCRREQLPVCLAPMSGLLSASDMNVSYAAGQRESWPGA
jgi:hypothetical protein